MKGSLLLNHDENLKQVENEEKSRFLIEILMNCFDSSEEAKTQLDNIFNLEDPLLILPASKKIQLKQLLSIYNIEVIDDNDGSLTIYLDKEKIAEFHKPLYKMKKDYSQLDRKKRFYLEMTLNFWTIFEQPEEEDK